MMRLRYAAIALTLLPLAAIALLCFRSVSGPVTIIIERSQTSVARAVDDIDAIAHLPDHWFVQGAVKLGLRISGKNLIPGRYSFSANTTQLHIIITLVRGQREPLVKVTFPEGFTIYQIASRLKQRTSIDSAGFITWCSLSSTRQTYNITSPTMEGYLMPATYHLIEGESPASVGAMMADQALRVWQEIQGSSPAKRDSIVTLASIVQKEAARNDELEMIAGVYANRLRRGMRLEADPTLQYGRDLAITRQDLADETNLYNTYRHGGLPPGPICNPGKMALQAAIAPQQHDYVFFVARGDRTMGHRFSRTYGEHQQNVQLYRATKKQP